jgi:hypothetical protein
MLDYVFTRGFGHERTISTPAPDSRYMDFDNWWFNHRFSFLENIQKSRISTRIEPADDCARSANNYAFCVGLLGVADF